MDTKSFNFKIIQYLIYCVVLMVSISYVTIFELPVEYGLFLTFRIILLILLFFSVSVLFNEGIIKNFNLIEWKKNFYTSGFSVLGLFIILELIFTLVPRSHGVGFAYAAKNWSYYFVEKNDLGFRDDALSKKKNDLPTILFIGDSFTKGSGVKNTSNRFANLTHKEIENCFEMILFANGGMNTVDQLNILNELDFVPSKIVFQYYGNDIEGDAINLGKTRDKITGYSDLKLPSKIIVQSSYFFNYLYWLYPRQYLDGYVQYLINCYKDKEIFDRHKATLQELLMYCNERDIEIYSLVIPFLQDIELSKDLYVNDITEILNNPNMNSKVINIVDKIEVIPVEDRIVNSNDPHANETINLIIANELISKLKKFCN